jgi:cobalt-zinc-cadmium efflux system outer membrane protein
MTISLQEADCLSRVLVCGSGLWVLAACCCLAADDPGSAALTIGQAVAEAVQNNPSLIARRLGISVAETAQITARLRPNPVLSASSDHLDWLGTGYNVANAAGPAETAIRIDMPFERAHKREYRLDTANYEAQIARARYTDALRLLRQDVTLAAIDVLEAKARLALANDNLKSLDGIVQLNQTRLNGGAIAPVELTRSRVAMLQFRATVKSAELSLLTARTRLHTLLGRKAADPLADISGDMKAPLPSRPPDLVAIQNAAINSRPDLLAGKLEQARSQADLRLQIAQGKVDYTVGAEYRRQQGINGKGNSLGFFVSVPLPVYNRNQGEIARVRTEQEQISKTLDALQTQIAGEVTTAYQEFETARQLIDEIERDLLTPSAEARSTTAYVYQAGASSLIDVLDAQRAFNETMSAYYSAQADYRRAATKLASVVGQEVIP